MQNRKLRDLQRKLDTTISERKMYQNQHVPNKLTQYQEKLAAELKEHDAQLAVQKTVALIWWKQAKNKASHYFRTLRDYLLDIGNLGGTAGFVANIIVQVGELTASVGTGLSYFFAVVASPLALTAISLGVLLENYEIYTNNAIKQRKTRYAVNTFVIALAAVAMVIALGLIAAAPPFSIGILFGGMISAGYYKDYYIQKQLQIEIANKEDEGSRLRGEISAAIESKIKENADLKFYQQELTIAKSAIKNLLLNPAPTKIELTQINALRKEIAENKLNLGVALLKDPYISRLTMQYAENRDAYEDLKISRANIQTAQQVRRWSLLGVALIVSGGILALTFPPMAGLLLVLGALMVLGTVIKNHYQTIKEKKAATQRTNELSDRKNEDYERSLVISVHDAKLNKTLSEQTLKTPKTSTSLIAPKVGGIEHGFREIPEQKQVTTHEAKLEVPTAATQPHDAPKLAISGPQP